MWGLACGLVAAALYRYDTALYLGAATVVAFATLYAGTWRTWAPALARCAIPIACLSLPVLLFLQTTGGLVSTVDQVVAYARREGAGTRISVTPRLSLTAPVSLTAVPTPSQTVIIRWVSSAANGTARKAAESRHHLLEGAPRGERADRTWSYRMIDASPLRVRELLQDVAVEDTSGIERERSMLTPDPWWIRAQRAVPVLRLRLLAGAWNADNANAFLYDLLHVLPLIAMGVLLLNASSRTPVSRVAMARVSSLIVLCTTLNVFILLQLLTAHPAALVIHRTADRDFADGYPLLSEYVRAHYHQIGTTDFSGGSSPGASFLVLAHNDRVSTARHGPTSLPCLQ